MKKILSYLNTTLIWVLLTSCEGFLDEKPVKSILVPSTVEDVRALLDNYTTLNDNTLISFILADDWQTNSANWQTLQPWEQNAYLWKRLVFDPQERSTDYSKLHRKIFFANNCLEILQKLPEATIQTRELRGEALFVRSLALYHLAQLFLPYPSNSQANSVRIPVRFTAQVSGKSELLTVNQIFLRIEEDLLLAEDLLPNRAGFPNRPDKRSAQALLSGIYLYVGKYDQALESAREVLSTSEGLINYQSINSAAPYPFSVFNKETLYYGVTSSFSVTASSATFVDRGLYQSYSDNDLRKRTYFSVDAQGNALFRGSYLGDFNLFSGLSLSEVVLNGAEAAFRIGQINTGTQLLTQLASNRYRELSLWNQQVGQVSLSTVLEERRKELIFRGGRWGDMKRLAGIGELRLPLSRVINGETFRLESNEQFVLDLPGLEKELEEF